MKVYSSEYPGEARNGALILVLALTNFLAVSAAVSALLLS